MNKFFLSLHLNTCIKIAVFWKLATTVYETHQDSILKRTSWTSSYPPENEFVLLFHNSCHESECPHGPHHQGQHKGNLNVDFSVDRNLEKTSAPVSHDIGEFDLLSSASLTSVGIQWAVSLSNELGTTRLELSPWEQNKTCSPQLREVAICCFR